MKTKYLILIFIVIFALLTICLRAYHSTTKENSQTNQLPKIILGTDWFAQAEHGGFYQAIADGTYKNYGLDVQIRMGGPQVNGIQLLLAGETHFFLSNSYVMLQAIQNKIPVVSVAALFQKDIQILMTHPGVGHDSLESLKGKSIFISAPTAAAIWGFLAGKYGYTEDQKKSYSHSFVPFLNDKFAIQEGILTSEPFIIEKQGHFKPVTLLLSNYGYSAYGELLTCTREFEKNNSKIIQNFIKASVQGWKNYLQNPRLGNELIKRDNPQMSEELINYAIEKLKEEKILTGGDAQSLGIGAMTEARWNDFYNSLLKYKSIEENLPIHEAYTIKYMQK